MHRIIRSEIQWIAGDAYYGGGMFSGTSFREEDGLIEARSFELGRDVGQYSCKHMRVPKYADHVHADSPDLEGESGYEQVTFRGELLTGVVYDFGGPFCMEEILYIEGWPHVEIDWYSNGHLEAWEHFRYGQDGAGGRFSWTHMGLFTGCYIIKGPGVNLTWRIAPSGGVEWFEVAGDFFHTKKDTVDELPFADLIPTLTEIGKSHGAEKVFLYEDGINEETFGLLAADYGLLNTESITMCDTSLGADDINKLEQSPNLPDKLKVLEIRDEPGALEDAVKALKRQRPDLIITYNNQVL